MPAEKIFGLPASTSPRTPLAMAVSTAWISARHTSVLRALTGGRARRISRMSPWSTVSIRVDIHLLPFAEAVS
jgi:hypothetical protein